MLIPTEAFADSLKNQSYAELVEMKADFGKSVEEYVQNFKEEMIDSSPDVIDQMNREYLSAPKCIK